MRMIRLRIRKVLESKGMVHSGQPLQSIRM